MKRQHSAKWKAMRDKMRASLTECHDCTDYATELHHIVAVEDGGTDDESNLMPLCRDCHREYTSRQTIERNQVWVEIGIGDDGELTTRVKGDDDGEAVGRGKR